MDTVREKNPKKKIRFPQRNTEETGRGEMVAPPLAWGQEHLAFPGHPFTWQVRAHHSAFPGAAPI